MTADANKDFYISGLTFAFWKDITATTTYLAVSCTIDGATATLVIIPTQALFIETGQIAISFPFPIRIDRSSSITMTASTNVANFASRCTIYGYYDDVARA